MVVRGSRWRGGRCGREGWRWYGATSVGNRSGTTEMPTNEAADVKEGAVWPTEAGGGSTKAGRARVAPHRPHGRDGRGTDRGPVCPTQRDAVEASGEEGRSFAQPCRDTHQRRANRHCRATPPPGHSTTTPGTVTRGGCGSPMTPRSRPPRLLAPPRPRWMDAHATRGGANGTNLSPQLRGGVAAGGGAGGRVSLSEPSAALPPARAHTRGGGVGVVVGEMVVRRGGVEVGEG